MADQDFIISIRTTTDLAGIKATEAELKSLGIQVESVRKASGQGGGPAAGASSAGDLGRLIGQIAGISIGAGIYAFVDGLKKASAEIAKVSDDLSKQGAQLVAHAQLFDQQARHAKNLDDVIKVSDATLKDMAATQKTLTDLTEKELGHGAKISDYLQAQLLSRQRAAGMGDYEAARQENIKTAFEQYQAARQRGMAELLAAEKAANQTLEEKIAILNREIATEERRKQAALANTDPGGYAQAGNNLNRLRKDLGDVTKLKQQQDTEAAETARKAQEDAYGAASPQAKAILRNEQAARDARARGDERGAEQFQASAEQLKKSASAMDLKSYEDVVKSYGESPAALSDIERNKRAFDVAEGGRDYSGLAGDKTKYDPRAAEIERQTQNANTEREGDKAHQDRHDALLDYLKSIWGGG